jgi:hypothetical protein
MSDETPNYTFATVIIADADKTQACADLGDGMFSVPLSANGLSPATHWMSSGAFYDDQLAFIEHEASWDSYIALTQDWETVIADEGLQMVVESTPTTEL